MSWIGHIYEIIKNNKFYCLVKSRSGEGIMEGCTFWTSKNKIINYSSHVTTAPSLNLCVYFNCLPILLVHDAYQKASSLLTSSSVCPSNSLAAGTMQNLDFDRRIRSRVGIAGIRFYNLVPTIYLTYLKRRNINSKDIT